MKLLSNGQYLKVSQRRWLQLVKVLVTVCLLTYLVMRLQDDLNQTLNRIWSMNPLWIGAAACGVLLSKLTLILRQHSLLKHMGTHVPPGLLIRITLAGYFSNNFFPGGSGLDLMRLIYFQKATGLPYSHLSSLILLDRILGVTVLALVASPMLILYLAIENGRGLWRSMPGIEIAVLVAIPFAISASLLSLKHQNVFRFMTSLTTRLPGGASINAMCEAVNSFANDKMLLKRISLMAMIGHIGTCAGVSALAFAMYGKHDAFSALSLSPFVFLSSTIPVTPGNLGWTETVADTLWNIFQVQGGLAIFLTWRVINSVVSLIGAPAYLTLGPTLKK